LLSLGMKPIVELSFMPDLLASGPQTLFHYKANATLLLSTTGRDVSDQVMLLLGIVRTGENI